tara:strand:+ start:155 stop:328 length:174 start_codon:yes stop_codon:yes gene_type:complete
MSKIKVNVITQEEKVTCLKGYEDFDTESIAKRLPKKRYLKSSKELKYEKKKEYSHNK